MITAKTLQDEIQALEQRMQSIENTHLSPDGLTIKDIISLSKQIAELKTEVNRMQVSSGSGCSADPPPCHYPAPDSSAYPQNMNHKMPSVPQKSSGQTPQTSDKPFRPKFQITEGNVGRYVIGILASLLILLAVGTIAGAVWEYIPEGLKFLGLLAIGVCCEAAGWQKLKKTGVSNGFWTSLTGLGSAISFAALIFGHSLWTLYSSIFTGVFLLIWFAVNFALSTNANSKVFYIIAYIGGFIAMSLIFSEGGSSAQKEVLIIAAVSAIYLMGKLGIHKTHNTVLPVLNMAFCLNIIQQIRTTSFWARHEFAGHALSAVYVPYYLIAFQIVLAAIILLDMANIWHKDWGFAAIMDIVLPCIGAVTLASSCYDFVEILMNYDGVQAEVSAGIRTLLGLLCCGIAYKDKLGKYILGISPVAAAILSVISGAWLGCSAIIPAAAAACLMFVPSVRKDKYVRAAGIIAYLTAFMSASSEYLPEGELGVWLWVQTLLLVAIPTVNYVLIYRQRDGIFPELEALVGIACASMAINPLASYMEATDMLWVLMLAGLTLCYRYFLPNKPVSEYELERVLAKAALLLTAAIVCLCSYTGGLIMPDHADKVIATIVLTAYSMASMYTAINHSQIGYSIFSAVFCNWNALYILMMWNSNSANILISCVGLLLAAAFIAIGFWKKKKNIRITGLVAMVGYVFKIALFDVAQSAGAGSQIFALLAGGIICFAVSFAYNKLGLV